MIELKSIFQHVGSHCALADISLELNKGEWLFLVGPNGAGKSLLTRLLLGLDSPSAGTIRLFGRDLGELSDRAVRRLRRNLGAVLQGGSLLADMTVLENLLVPLRATALSRDEIARAARLIMTQVQLDGLDNHLPRSLSLGQRRRAELARALIHKPLLLVCDGLTDGLDQPGAREIFSVLREQQMSRQLTLVATENRADLPLIESDRIRVIDRGSLLFEGSPTELEHSIEERLELRYILRGEP